MPELVIDDGGLRSAPPEVCAELPLAPIPSAKDLVDKGPPLANVAVKSPLGARLQALAPSGEAALKKRLGDIAAMVRSGTKVRCVFDLDNTLFDTRHRTMFCCAEFDRLNGTHHFDGMLLGATKVDGRETAIALGLPNDVVEAFGDFWDREFWNPQNLVHDEPIQAMVDVVNECKKRGAEICFLTGRCDSFVHPQAPERGQESFRGPTHDQLTRAGIDVDDAHLALKPRLGVWTPEYKQGQLQAWWHDAEIGVFLTEGRRDLAYLERQLANLPCFRLDCSFEDSGPACAGIPTLQRPF